VRPRLAFPEWISSPAENCVITDLPLDRFQSKLFEQLFEEVVARCLEAGGRRGQPLGGWQLHRGQCQQGEPYPAWAV